MKRSDHAPSRVDRTLPQQYKAALDDEARGSEREAVRGGGPR
jgi:hypothetical protein